MTSAPLAPRGDLAIGWPMVGRSDHLERALEELVGTSARTVVLAGPAGAGKTRLLAEVVARAEAAGSVVARVAATRSASSIPFGAIAPLLPVDELLADSLLGVLQRAARVITDLGGGQQVLIAVDDANHLDEASATLIHQLALDGRVRVVLAIRHGEQLSAALASVVGDPARTVTLHLPELVRADVEQLATLVLGQDVAGAVVHSLWDASRGNALYLRELLMAWVEDGSLELVGGIWRLAARPTVPARLIELVELRLATVDDDERVVLELLAVGRDVGRSALELLVGPAALRRLLQRGLVRIERDGRRQPVRLHHPLYEEAIRRRLSSRRLRSNQIRLADLVQRHGLRRRGDQLRVTTLKLEAGVAIEAETVEAAAVEAYFALDIQLAERLARAGVAAGAGPRLRRILAEVMRWQGRHEEAEAIIAASSFAGATDEERALSALVRAENLFRGLGQRDASMLVLREGQAAVREPAWLDELVAMGAVFDALAGDVRAALAIAAPIIAGGPSRAMAVASTAAVAALTFSGRADDAAKVAEEAFAVASLLAPQESQGVAATHVMERCLALIEAGRLDEGEMIGRMSYEWSLAGSNAIGQGWFSMLLARSAQVGGRVEEATRRFRESSLLWRDLRDEGLRRWALAGLAQSAAACGRVSDASMALDEIDTAPPTAVHLLEAEVLRARAWLAISRGSGVEGRRLLFEAASWAADRGQHGLELTMLHDLVRVGDVRAPAARAAVLGMTLQGPLAAARGRHAAAAHARDASGLDEASLAFAEISANLFAAEAAAQAALVHQHDGRPSRAVASRASSVDLAARCEGASTPSLAAEYDPPGMRLTPRELEISRFAAAGRSSADIAAQLGISVRTVNNLLQRAYVKLGVSGRHELPTRLTSS